jgi:ubiquinone/menaquinone biosynthesis C-methylase UbiE
VIEASALALLTPESRPSRLNAMGKGRDMGQLEDAREKAIATYNAAADSYDDAANSFWDRFGRRTIEGLRLARGAAVLDVCCGSGASAIPAAQAVGRDGSVLGIDLAERLLEVARTKAKSMGLQNIEFRIGDMLDLGLPEASFDAVVCVFGIFFVPDMTAAVRELWKVVRPGGKLGITTWGPRFFEPGNTAFWNAVRDVAPDLHKAFNPWDRICDPQSVRRLLADAGIAHSEVMAEAGEHAIASPEAWWSAVRGSGYRGTLERLSEAERELVRAANLAFVRDAGIRSVEANVVYAVATKTNG